MLSKIQRDDLRDRIFSMKLRSTTTGIEENALRFLAVSPPEKNSESAVVHFAYNTPVWDRAEMDSSPLAVVDLLKAKVEEAGYSAKEFSFKNQKFLGGHWPIPWEETAKASHNDFPVLILRIDHAGQYEGCLLRDSRCCQMESTLAQTFVEAEELDTLFERMHLLGQAQPLRVSDSSQTHLGCYKERDLKAGSLEEAIAMTPETPQGQKRVLLYKDGQWLSGIWNREQGDSLSSSRLRSIADFAGTRVSKKHKSMRDGLSTVRASQTERGDYGVLLEAVRLIHGVDPEEDQDLEQLPAIKTLCQWWNTNAPANMRSAGCFRLYIWDEENKIFIAGDPEEPSTLAADAAKRACFSLFEKKGCPVVMISFCQGRSSNEETEFGTQTYCADGSEGWTIGATSDEVDEAYYSLIGLRALLVQAPHIFLEREAI